MASSRAAKRLWIALANVMLGTCQRIGRQARKWRRYGGWVARTAPSAVTEIAAGVQACAGQARDRRRGGHRPLRPALAPAPGPGRGARDRRGGPDGGRKAPRTSPAVLARAPRAAAARRARDDAPRRRGALRRLPPRGAGELFRRARSAALHGVRRPRVGRRPPRRRARTEHGRADAPDPGRRRRTARSDARGTAAAVS